MTEADKLSQAEYDAVWEACELHVNSVGHRDEGFTEMAKQAQLMLSAMNKIKRITVFAPADLDSQPDNFPYCSQPN